MAVIKLKDYQRECVDAVYSEWESGHRRAVVSLPPGTGKFFIEAAIAEQEARARVLAVAPSRAILEQQARNLARLYPSADVSNLEMTTYAQLAADHSAGRALPVAEIVLLDELHRAGAASWMPAVDALIAAQSEEPRVLGLSATCVRYSEGASEERDMSLVVSGREPVYSMTLAGALQRGILARPRYVSMIYRWEGIERSVEQDIENACDYEKDELRDRYKKAKKAIGESTTVAEAVRQFLPASARKAIVFCRNGSDVSMARASVRTWFKGRNPKAFTMLYSDSHALEALEGFERDPHSGLKVLLCVDMLNEGVHVDAVDAVVFLRPSSSPIIYVQQLGRALDSGSDSSPVIFDLVNNLSSMGGLVAALGGDKAPICQGEGGRGRSFDDDWIDQLVDYEPVDTDLQKALLDISARARAPKAESIRRCRDEHPSWTHSQIADACGTSKGNVTYALAKDGPTAYEKQRLEREELISEYALANPYFGWKRMSEELEIPIPTCKRIAKRLGIAPKKFPTTQEQLLSMADDGPLPTAAECAQRLGVSTEAVHKAAKAAGLKLESARTDADLVLRRRAWICEHAELIKSGKLGYADVAEQLDITVAMAGEYCRKLGIHGRSGSKSCRRKRADYVTTLASCAACEGRACPDAEELARLAHGLVPGAAAALRRYGLKKGDPPELVLSKLSTEQRRRLDEREE